MKLAVDLHSHSGYAGGVGQIELYSVTASMKLKGIDIFGTGDCLLPQRTSELKQQLSEIEDGLFALPNDSSRFVLQTEVIFSTRLPDYKNKIIAHHIILFPGFSEIRKMQKLLTKWKVKNTIGRPFIVSDSQIQLADQLFQLTGLHPLIEIIPAHIMTPDGVLGSKNNLRSMRDFYGEFLPHIHCIETGLSADPEMLQKIPELADLTFISNSDCHSAALNRIGREFTVLKVQDKSYPSLIQALRNNNVDFTAEFNPSEGRYYLTGHRANRPGHDHSFIMIDELADLICPICHKTLLPGVAYRCKQLQNDQIVPLTRRFKHLIPLTEVIAFSLMTQNVNSQKVIEIYQKIMTIFQSEIELWQSAEIEVMLDNKIPSKTISSILSVQKGDFRFDPAGFDGQYGSLKID